MTAPVQLTPVEAGQNTCRAVGRLLRTLRIACGMGVDDAAVAAEVTSARLRELEAGLASLEYLEGIRLAKAYLLCPTCFKRHFEGAVGREAVADEQ